jgi:hypothetical protein
MPLYGLSDDNNEETNTKIQLFKLLIIKHDLFEVL